MCGSQLSGFLVLGYGLKLLEPQENSGTGLGEGGRRAHTGCRPVFPNTTPSFSLSFNLGWGRVLDRCEKGFCFVFFPLEAERVEDFRWTAESEGQ